MKPPACGISCTVTRQAVRLVGELDLSNVNVVEGALACGTSPRGRGRTLCLELCGLEFCDVAGVRALLDGTEKFRSEGNVVVLLRPTPAVRRIFQLLDVPEAPGIRLVLEGGSEGARRLVAMPTQTS